MLSVLRANSKFARPYLGIYICGLGSEIKVNNLLDHYYSLLFQQGIPLQPKAAFQGALHNMHHNTDSHKHIYI